MFVALRYLQLKNIIHDAHMDILVLNINKYML